MTFTDITSGTSSHVTLATRELPERAAVCFRSESGLLWHRTIRWDEAVTASQDVSHWMGLSHLARAG